MYNIALNTRIAPMKKKIGKLKSSIANLELSKRYLTANTLILANEGYGKTNLAAHIRKYVIQSNTPTLYLDFSSPKEGEVEEKFKDENFNYIEFDETNEFQIKLDLAIKDKKHIYLSVSPEFFSSSRDEKSILSSTIQKRDLLDNYYYFFHEISELGKLYTQFDDFLIYILRLISLKKLGLTFLSQPHKIFENSHVKQLFTFLYLGHVENVANHNSAMLKNLKSHNFFYQYRSENNSFLLSQIKSDTVIIDS